MSNNQEPWWTPGNNLVPKALADHNENSSWVSGSERSRNYRWMVKLIRSSVLKASAVDCRSISSIDTPSAPRLTHDRHLGGHSVGSRPTFDRCICVGRHSPGYRLSTLGFLWVFEIVVFFVTYTQEKIYIQKFLSKFYDRFSQSTGLYRSRFGWMTFLYSLPNH